MGCRRATYGVGMKTTRPIAAAAAIPLLLLAGCAQDPGVDLSAARQWADEVSAAASDGPGFAGAAATEVGTEKSESGVMLLELQPGTVLTRVDARCYGGDVETISTVVTITLDTGDGVDDTIEREIPCDEEAHAVDLRPTAADSLMIEGVASAPTYLHATAIIELRVEQ